MKTWAIAGLLVGFGLPLCSGHGQEADAESKIIALERVAKLQACESKDLKTLDTMLDDSFAFVDAEGQLRNKAEVLALIQTATPMKFGVDDMVVRLQWRCDRYRAVSDEELAPWRSIRSAGSFRRYVTLQKRPLGRDCKPVDADE